MPVVYSLEGRKGTIVEKIIINERGNWAGTLMLRCVMSWRSDQRHGLLELDQTAVCLRFNNFRTPNKKPVKIDRFINCSAGIAKSNILMPNSLLLNFKNFISTINCIIIVANDMHKKNGDIRLNIKDDTKSIDKNTENIAPEVATAP